MTPAGARNQSVQFQQRAVDDNGDRLGAWEIGFSRLARVVPRTRGETALQQRIQGLQLLEVFVLADDETRSVDNAWRLIWNDVAFNIQAAVPSEDRREIQLLAQADQSDA